MTLISFSKKIPEVSKKKESKTVDHYKPSIAQRISSFWRYKVLFTIIYSKKIPIPIAKWHRLYKRITHLFRMFFRWEELEDISRHGRTRSLWDTQERRELRGESVFNSLQNRLKGLKLMMSMPDYLECYSHEKSRHILMFKGRYCQHIREYRGFSRERLCNLINAHCDISKLDEYASKEFFKFYPISPKFLADFEEENLNLMKYKDAHVLKHSGGFSFSFADYGFPYDFFLEMVSKICCVHEEGLSSSYKTEYDIFRQWIFEYTTSTVEPNPEDSKKLNSSRNNTPLKFNVSRKKEKEED